MRVSFLIIIIFTQCYFTCADECHKLVGHLGSAQKDFVYCTTTNAVPVTLCIGCVSQYDEMLLSYSNLANNTNCSSIYFDNDRINVISTTQSILVGLWNKAYCSDCFNGNHSTTFDNKSLVLQDCLDAHKGTECESCKLEYIDLNDYYIKLDTTNKGHICFDIEDKMNITRKHWSKELKCCKREFKMTLFLSFSILLAIVPIIFYTTLYAYGKRREMIHDVLNNEDSEATTSRVPNPTTSTATPTVSTETAAASMNNINDYKKNKVFHDDDSTESDSDESDVNVLKKRFK